MIDLTPRLETITHPISVIVSVTPRVKGTRFRSFSDTHKRMTVSQAMHLSPPSSERG